MCQWGAGVGPGGRDPNGGGRPKRRHPLEELRSSAGKLVVFLLYVALLTPEVTAQSTNTTTLAPASTTTAPTTLASTPGTTRKPDPTPVSWGSGVKITSLRVPHVVRNGSESGATLDCEFWVSRDAEAGLVVKWFLNNGPAPVYQWIPGNGKEPGKPGSVGNGGGSPQGLGPLKGKLDLGFVHHHDDPLGMDGLPVAPSGEPGAEDGEARKHQSALRIRKPTTDLSGDYKCSVSTFHDEDSMVKRMLVFAPEKSMVLSQSRAKVATGDGIGDGSTTSYLNVTCYARGIYPEPKMALLWDPPSLADTEGSGEGDGPSEGSSHELEDRLAANQDASELEGVSGGSASVETTWRPEAGVFDIKASESLPERTLASPTVFHCELRIPEADYSVRRSLVYYPGNPDISNDGASINAGCSSSWIRLFMVLCLCLALVNFSTAMPPTIL